MGGLSAQEQDRIEAAVTEGDVAAAFDVLASHADLRHADLPKIGKKAFATIAGDPNRAAHFAFEIGALLDDGDPAPARRVGAFVDHGSTHERTPAGAPGPPIEMAMATPPMLPSPTVAESAALRAWKWFMAPGSFGSS